MKLLKTSTVVLLCLFFFGTFISEADAGPYNKRHNRRNRARIGLNLNLGAPTTTYVATPGIVPAPAPMIAAPAYPYAAPAYPYQYQYPYAYQYPTYYQAPAPVYSYYQAPVVVERQPFLQTGIGFSFRR